MSYQLIKGQVYLKVYKVHSVIYMHSVFSALFLGFSWAFLGPLSAQQAKSAKVENR